MLISCLPFFLKLKSACVFFAYFYSFELDLLKYVCDGGVCVCVFRVRLSLVSSSFSHFLLFFLVIKELMPVFSTESWKFASQGLKCCNMPLISIFPKSTLKLHLGIWQCCCINCFFLPVGIQPLCNGSLGYFLHQKEQGQ